MHYFLFARAVGFCANRAFELMPGQLDKPCVVYHGGVVWDVCSVARAKHIRIGMSLKDAKTILREEGLYLEYKSEDFEHARERFLFPCLKYVDAVRAGLAGEVVVDLSRHPHPLDIAGSLLQDLSDLAGGEIWAGLSSTVWVAKRSAQVCDTAALTLGLFPVHPVEDPGGWLASQPVMALEPIGFDERRRLVRLGFDFVRQVQAAPLKRLEEQFPGRGLLIQQVARGVYSEPFQTNYPGGFLAEEVRWGATESQIEIEAGMQRLATRLSQSLSEKDMQAGRIRLLVVFKNGRRELFERKLAKPVLSANQLLIGMVQLFQKVKVDSPIESVKCLLLDLAVGHRSQTSFLADLQRERAGGALDKTVQTLNASFGTGAVHRGSSICLNFNQKVMKEWKDATGWK